MNDLKKFLVLIINRNSGETLKEFDCIDAVDWYYARHIGISQYEKEVPKIMRAGDYYADSLELE